MTEQEAEIKSREIFDLYKQLYPNSKAQYVPSVNNLALWKWSIKQSKRRITGVEINIEPSESAIKIRDSRKVLSFDDFPGSTKAVYLAIADHFPSVQIYATGSRVNGDYIDGNSLFSVRYMRNELGKAEKEISDFDFTFYSKNRHENIIQDCKAFISQQFGVKADACPFALLDHKIKIPMWDFDKLTTEQKKQARTLYLAQRWGALMKLHNDLKISPNQYCCNEAPIIKWFKWAYENDKI
jgi:hypothetical protein